MAKYSKKAGEKVKDAMHEMKRGKLKSGRSGKTVTSRKQAVAIGLSEARERGAKVPKKAASKSRTAGKATSRKRSASGTTTRVSKASPVRAKKTATRAKRTSKATSRTTRSKAAGSTRSRSKSR